MKKLLLLFIATTILISCESNNDDDLDLDPIIGTWQLQSVLEDGTEQTTECQRKTTIVFLENGTSIIESFYDDNNGNVCESDTDTSSWANIGDSTYRIESDDEQVKLNFSENNTVFSASMTEVDNGMTYTITITYNKI